MTNSVPLIDARMLNDKIDKRSIKKNHLEGTKLRQDLV